MKNILALIIFLSFYTSSNAATGSLDVFNCTIEDKQTGEIKNENIHLESGNILYAPAFKGNIAKGSDGVKAEENKNGRLYFMKKRIEDTLTILLTPLGSNADEALTNYRYLELLSPGVSKVFIRTGFCTRYAVNR